MDADEAKKELLAYKLLQREEQRLARRQEQIARHWDQAHAAAALKERQLRLAGVL